jgi:hypothetical protein
LYTVLLIISLVAILLGSFFLAMETESLEYPGKPPWKNLPPVSMSTEKGDCPHLPERPGGCFAQMGTVPFFRLGPAAVG